VDATAGGRFQAVIDDAEARERASRITRLVFCSGKVYVDLITSDLRERASHVAIARIEQLYPFPDTLVRELLSRYPSVREVVWLQEEPENMGAWEFVRPLLEELIGDRYPLRYIGRARAASPAEGSAAWHQLNQRALVETALEASSEAAVDAPLVLSKRV
jgi:2-oxoglutarate dehydrogenase E1 component